MTRTILLLTAAATLGAAHPVAAQEAPPAPAADTPAGARAMADPDVVTVRNVTRVELTPGLPIVEDGGAIIGTVARLAGNDVILARDGAEYRVPIAQVYAYSQDGVDRFASRTPKAALQPETGAAVAAH